MLRVIIHDTSIRKNQNHEKPVSVHQNLSIQLLVLLNRQSLRLSSLTKQNGPTRDGGGIWMEDSSLSGEETIQFLICDTKPKVVVWEDEGRNENIGLTRKFVLGW